MNQYIRNWEDVPLYMDLSTAGEIVGLNPNYLSILARKHKFPAFKIGDSWRVDRDELLCYIERRKQEHRGMGKPFVSI